MRKLLVLIVLMTWATAAVAAVSIPITIQETIPSDVAGLELTSEPASFGVPLADSDAVSDIQHLGLDGASAGQFRITARYPSGNARWVLVDTLADVPAGGTASVTLTDSGDGNFGGSDLATDNGDTITIDTGTAVFVIKKTNFNFIDQLTIGGTEIISTGQSLGFHVSDGTTDYYSSYDENSTTEIEENGPVKACIKSSGVLKDSGGTNQYLHYTVRMYLYRGKGFVRCTMALRNASDDATKESHPVKVFGIGVKLNHSSQLSFEFARETETVTGVVDGDKYLYQGYVTDFNTMDNHLNYALITSDTGININGTAYDEWSRGFASAYSSSDGVYCNSALAYFGGFWPAGIEIHTDGTVEVDGYSGRNSVTPIIQYGTHLIRRVIFDFGNSAIDPVLTLHRVQYPLMGRPSIADLNRSKALFGCSEFISVDEENQYISDHSFTPMVIDTTSDRMNVLRKKNWSGTGGFQSDIYEGDLLNYFRTGYGLLLNRTDAAVLMKMGTAIFRSDDFIFDDPTFSNASTYTSPFDWAHTFWESMPIFYFMTGDEFIPESFSDFFEWFDSEAKETEWRYYYNPLDAGDLRGSSRMTIILSLLTDFFHTQTYHDYIVHTAKLYISHEDRRLERGYFNGNCEGESVNGEWNLRDFMVTRIHMPAFFHMYRVLKTIGEDELAEDLGDILLGWSCFYMDEFVDASYPSNAGESIYSYKTGEANDAPSGSRYGDPNQCLSLAYLMTADSSFFDKRSALNGVVSQRGQHDYAVLKTFPFIYHDINRDAYAQGYLYPVGSGRVDMGNSGSSDHITRNGSVYTITWTVPEDGITEYQIHVAGTPIVIDKIFDQRVRTFTFGDGYTNEYASLNVFNEPAPEGAGSVQSVDIDVAQVISNFNTRYDLQPGDVAYKEYDDATDYYFSLKYYKGVYAPPQSPDEGSIIGGNSEFSNIGTGASVIAFRTHSYDLDEDGRPDTLMFGSYGGNYYITEDSDSYNVVIAGRVFVIPK